MQARSRLVLDILLVAFLAYLIAPWIFEGWMRLVPRLRHILYIELLWHGSTRWVSVYAVVWGSALWYQLASQRWNQYPRANFGGRLLVCVLLMQIGILYLIVTNPQFWRVDTDYFLSPTIRTGWSVWHLVEVPINVLILASGFLIFVNEKGIHIQYTPFGIAEEPGWLLILVIVLFYWGVSWWVIYRCWRWQGDAESEQSWLRIVYWGGLGWFAFIFYLDSFWLFFEVGYQWRYLLTIIFWKRIGFWILLLMGLCLLLTVGLLTVKRRRLGT